jgi:hypothetical protein
MSRKSSENHLRLGMVIQVLAKLLWQHWKMKDLADQGLDQMGDPADQKAVSMEFE